MDENLVGYLLKALDANEASEIESRVRREPELQGRLDILRRALAPLGADREPAEPPDGLWIRTLGRVAEHRCRTLPHAPETIARPAVLTHRSWWRRPDFLVAASILLCLGLLFPAGLNVVRFTYQVAACKNNLRTFHTALQDYSERHDGNFPDIAAAAPAPRNVAGMLIPMLNEEKLLPAATTVSCPANAGQPASPLSVKDLERMELEDFFRSVQALNGCYAYSLGYADSTGFHGLRFDPNQPNSFLPILADRAPAGVALGDPDNSPNHAGYGQNVLYIDGHCAFWTKRAAGLEGDDIYLNFDHRVAAGKTPFDSVLASGAARP